MRSNTATPTKSQKPMMSSYLAYAKRAIEGRTIPTAKKPRFRYPASTTAIASSTDGNLPSNGTPGASDAVDGSCADGGSDADGDPDSDRRNYYPTHSPCNTHATASPPHLSCNPSFTSYPATNSSPPPRISSSIDVRSRRRDWMSFILILCTFGLGVFFAERGHDALAVITLTKALYHTVYAFINA